MIESICFKNFKALRDTRLPLGRCTLIVGPNGSGKTTALQALDAVREPGRFAFNTIATAGSDAGVVEVRLNWGGSDDGVHSVVRWNNDGQGTAGIEFSKGVTHCDAGRLNRVIQGIRVFSFEAGPIAARVELKSQAEMQENGRGLAGVLGLLRDEEPERFEQLNDEFIRWLPEYDRLLPSTLSDGQRALSLRTRSGHLKIPAESLSAGTVLSLAILTLAYLPEPPPLVGLEEPDHGIHPRLLRQVADAIYRLSHPESCGEKREPVQVVMTTHSPYFLDLFKDHPEEIVIAEKDEAGVHFHRLSDHPRIEEILGDAPLGEVWYSGILGGVPVEP